MLSRRSVLRGSLALAGSIVLPLSSSSRAAEPADRVFLGSAPGDPRQLVHAALEATGTDWLRRGDRVFLKVACNSQRKHPSSTSLASVSAMVQALRARGASKVFVGDQAGVMWVRSAAGGRRFSSTRSLMESNGLLQAIGSAGGEPVFFDEADFIRGHIPATLPQGSSWDAPPFIPRIITEVDHIIYLPRFATHGLTGYTHGHKLAVGWLRDDARHTMHRDAATLYEKYTEVSYSEEIGSRLRLTLTLAEQILVDGGPDDGATVAPEQPLVLASTNLAHHDAISVPILAWAKDLPPAPSSTAGIPFSPLSGVANLAFLVLVERATGIPWTSTGGSEGQIYEAHDFMRDIQSDRCLARAYAIQGGLPKAIDVQLFGSVPSSLRTQLEGRARLQA